MGRIIGIDIGRKRTGIAVTDPLQIIATRLATVITSEALDFLVSYSGHEVVDSFVVGYPRQMDNSPSESVQYIDPFVKKLKSVFPEKSVFLVDERFTSKLAVQAMVMGGVKKKRRQDKALIDGVSAAIILQAYLESRSIRENRTIRNEK